ncbi:MAG TPA: ATP-binding protein [Candidatus Bathyarchaeia archaeon]|nr:ATP-binding protein [Candidatus Bathyarchaeia archaeon]
MDDLELLKILYTHNPWWEGKKLTVPDKKRNEYPALWSALADKQITAIIGPRRVGKSVLMQQLIQQLIDEKTNSKNILFVQLDEPLFEIETEKNPLIHRLIDVYVKYILNKDLDSLNEKIYVFLDEIQHVEKWSQTLKSYYDRGYNIKFIVSGSSATGITRGSSESLAGRISLNLIMTLKFTDYLKFKNLNDELTKLSSKLQETLKSALESNDITHLSKNLNESYPKLVPYQRQIETALSQFMVKGGYIELIAIEDYQKCAQYLKDLLQLVIYKDIVKVFGIRNPKNMEDLLLYLANHSAQLFSETSASPKLKMKQETIGEYIDYLEEVFLINTCMIYSKNRARQLRNPKKIYTSDIGIRNVLNGTYSPKALIDASDIGLMAETIVHNHLQSLTAHLATYRTNCYYWKNKCEVDNVITFGKKPVPIEVKYQNEIRREDSESCQEFAERNSSPFSIIVTKDKLDFQDKIAYIPLWYFLLLC